MLQTHCFSFKWHLECALERTSIQSHSLIYNQEFLTRRTEGFCEISPKQKWDQDSALLSPCLVIPSLIPTSYVFFHCSWKNNPVRVPASYLQYCLSSMAEYVKSFQKPFINWSVRNSKELQAFPFLSRSLFSEEISYMAI